MAERPRLSLTLLPDEHSVCRLDPGAPLQPWMTSADHWCIARTPSELSIVCEGRLVPADCRSERGWRLIRVEGPLPFGLTGILSSVCQPLADAVIPIFAFSTFDTDYVLVKSNDLDHALEALVRAGHHVTRA